MSRAPAKPKPATAAGKAKANTAEGKAKPKTKRSPRRKTWTLRARGNTLLTTPMRHVAEVCAAQLFNDLRSVSLIDNETNRSVQHYVYGRPQK